MRLLIVDDHPMTCEGLRSLLAAYYPQAQIDAHQGVEALLRTPERWHYIFLDMHLPGVRFTQLLEDLRQNLARVILISASPEPEIVAQARARGVRGLLLKNADVSQILDGFQRIQAGEKVFIEQAGITGGTQPPAAPMTGRQQEVYEALLGGLSNKQIARKLDISEYTVKDHVTAILTLFGVRNRMELLLQQQRKPVV